MSLSHCESGVISSPRFIKYHPAYRQVAQTNNGAFLLDRLEYWFGKYPHGFYKFLEPCSHPTYRVGDSWAEEIGLGRKAFHRAFAKIGVRYTSKTMFAKSPDPFQGKLYAMYYDRKNNQMFFVRNHELAAQSLAHLKNPKTPPKEANGRSCTGQGGRSFTRAESNINSSNRTSSSNAHALSPEDQKIAEEMIVIWQKEIGALGVTSVSTSLLQRLHQAYQTLFDQDMEAWQDYCSQISSSNFLMGQGRAKTFTKIWITWAIQATTYQRITGGEFTLGDRQTNRDRDRQAHQEEIKDLALAQHQIQSQLENRQEVIAQGCKRKLEAAYHGLTPEDRRPYEQAYLQHIAHHKPTLYDAYQAQGWRYPGLAFLLECYIKQQLADTLNLPSVETLCAADPTWQALNHRHQEYTQALAAKRAALHSGVGWCH